VIFNLKKSCIFANYNKKIENMAKITLKYNVRNLKSKNLLNYVLTTGLLTPVIDEKSGLEMGFEDIEKGRIYHAVRKSKA
jgi:hypothetical protein